MQPHDRSNIRLQRLLSLCSLLAAGTIATTASASDVGKYPLRELGGDFNGDGHLDRVVATPTADGHTGKIELFIGDGTQGSLWWKGIYHSSWPKAPRVITEDDPIFGAESAANYRRFGAGLVVGDFDHDGKDDLAFGSPGARVDGIAYAGRAYVLYGKHLQKSGQTWNYTAASTYRQGGDGLAGAAEAYDYFGEFFTAADLNCDGSDDLVIGVPREDATIAAQTVADVGVVHVLYGATNTGLGTGDDAYFGEGPLGGATEAHDNFGAALTAGRYVADGGWSLNCKTLAIGVPGQSVSGKDNAGAIYTLNATASGLNMSATLWHQDSAGVDGSAGADEEFGARLGNASGPAGDGLWVEVPGELGCAVAERRFQLIPSGASGLTTVGDRRFCSRHEPGLTVSEVGRIVEKRDAYGPYMQYLPSGVDASSELLVVVHGTPTPLLASEDPWDHAARAARFWIDLQDAWIEVAERENLILIAPGFSATGFASVGLDPGHPSAALGAMATKAGGYRMLYGRDIQADAWVNLIVDSYKDVGLNPGGDLYIYGHSAGAQMVSRYVARNPTRLIAAALSSPNTTAVPVAGPNPKTWASGLGALQDAQWSWLKDDFSGLQLSAPYSYTPSASQWSDGLKRPIYVSVGELEQGDGDTHVATATAYLEQTDTFMGVMNKPSGVSLCVVAGVDHDYGDRLATVTEQLFPNGDPLTCVAP